MIAPAAYGLATAKTPARLDGGKKLYKKFCGQCHALKEARAVGIGLGATGNSGKGETDLAGPSFNELRVTAHQCMLAITGVWDGHAKVMTLMTHDDIHLVSDYIAGRDEGSQVQGDASLRLLPLSRSGGPEEPQRRR